MFDNIRVFVFDQGLMNQPDEVTSVRKLSEQVSYHDGDVLTMISISIDFLACLSYCRCKEPLFCLFVLVVAIQKLNKYHSK